MSIFQKSVINKYLQNLDISHVNEAYSRFNRFYGDKSRIENIKLLKEENYQEGFLREVFVQVLGYTINPDNEYNLTTEYKNETDAKKADGAILKDNEAIGVIELKSTKTKDLESIKEQAFNYKNNQHNCKYVITSNFEKLRFYIDNATEFEEFILFNLNFEKFKILYLILSKDSIFNNIPSKLKEESKLHEENISNKLYEDYSRFKRNIFNNLVKNHPELDKLELFHKSQKLLDRILFVLFAEDSGLIPPNAISKIIEQWKKLNELDEPVSLYSRYVKLFNHLNVGHKYSNYELHAYNGGLFKPDEFLDKAIIDDEILLEDSLKLSSYDFQTDVDVNILGQIFEHSIAEIEELTAELEGKEIDKKKSKRKKEGVYYTPKYITKYIVENTLGELCKEKKKELELENIDESVIENIRTKKGGLTKKGKDLLKQINEYRDYILSLKILDPACGSGAFLNQALEFLIDEHQNIDDIRKTLEQDSLGLFNIKNSILENNLYGVDINEESVEIAKLSLWLRTAEKGRKLTDLNNNIKCGNSLIDNPEIANEKAFIWEKEFCEIMSNGGFDIVIGNPPYVDTRSIEKDKVKFYKSNYYSAGNRVNTFALFSELSHKNLKIGGKFGMIIHRNLIRSNEYFKCREYILNNTEINSILSFGKNVFVNVTGEMTILLTTKKQNKNNSVIIYKYNNVIDSNVKPERLKQEIFENSIGKRFNIYLTKEKVKLLNKIQKNSISVGQIANTLQGIIAGDEKKYISKTKSSDIYKPVLRGRDISRYGVLIPKEYIYFVEGTKVLIRSRKRENFELEEKILTQHVSGRIIATIDNDKYYYMQTINGTNSIDENISNKYLLTIFNSKLIDFYYSNTFNLGAELTTAVAIDNIDLLPIKKISTKEQSKFIDRANDILTISKQFQDIAIKFINRAQNNLELLHISEKLSKFWAHDFKTFNIELKKQKINLSLIQQDEWEEYFNQYKSDINNLQMEINKTDKDIDQLVYELYGLNDEDIKIVEDSIKAN